MGSTKKEMQPIVLGQMEEMKWKLLWLIRKLKMHILSWLSPEHTLRLSVCLKCFALVQILESFKLSHAYFMITHLLIHSIHTGYLPPHPIRGSVCGGKVHMRILRTQSDEEVNSNTL